METKCYSGGHACHDKQRLLKGLNGENMVREITRLSQRPTMEIRANDLVVVLSMILFLNSGIAQSKYVHFSK